MPERDIVVVGAGAAGLSAAFFAAMEDMNVLVIEELASGGQQLLVDSLTNYPGVAGQAGYVLSQQMEEQAVAAGAEITNGSVEELRRLDDRFETATTKGVITSAALIICTGTEKRPLGVPGEKELTGKGVSSCAACDGPFFKGKRVVVVGGGDSACDEAVFLSTLAGSVLLVNRHTAFKAQASLARRVAATPAVEVRHETEVLEILGSQRLGTQRVGTQGVSGISLLDRASGHSYVEKTDAVFIFVGSFPRFPPFPGLKTDEGGYIATDHRMAANIPGVFAAGAVRASPFRQCIVAAGEGAVAGHSAASYVAGKALRSPG